MGHPDVIVVGAGIIGCAIAAETAAAGLSVVVLEREVIGHGASGRNSGVIRISGRHPSELPLITESIERWASVAQSDTSIDYVRGGSLWLAETAEQLERLELLAVGSRTDGTAPILLDRSELRRHLPDVGPTFCGGLRDTSAGHVEQRKATMYFALLAQSRGAVVREHVAVREIEHAEGAFRILADTLEMRAAVVVLAAGVWSSRLAAQLGLSLPIAVRRNHALRSAPVRVVTDEVVVAPQPETGHVVIRQLRDGSLTMSGFRRAEWVDVHVGDGLNQAASSETLEAATRVLPLLSNTSILARWSGLNDVTPDELPFLGADPKVPGLFIATGFSGHGFAIAPAVGAAIGRLITRGDQRHDLAAFRVDRFDGVDTAAALSRLTGTRGEGLLQARSNGG